MLSHSDIRPFKCTHPGCTQSTKTRADLNKHMRKHSTERNFLCEICSKGFKSQQSLRKHYPMHRDIRAFACDVCGFRFKSKAAMRKHVQLHSGIKPFKCEVCDMRFAVSNNLKTHMVTHDTSNRPFLCPLCPYAAKHQDHLLAHIGTFHGKSYTYFCEFCKKPFGRYGQLKTHYKRMHKNMDMSSLGQLDLSALKMELKKELEDASETMETEPKRLSKKVKKREVKKIAVIKEEPLDNSYGDVPEMKEKGTEENVETKSEEDDNNVYVNSVKASESKATSNSNEITDNGGSMNDQMSEKENVQQNEGTAVSSVTAVSDQMKEKIREEHSSQEQCNENSDEVNNANIILGAAEENDDSTKKGVSAETSSEKKGDESIDEVKDETTVINDGDVSSQVPGEVSVESSSEKKCDENHDETKDEPIVLEMCEDDDKINITDQSHIYCSSKTARLAVYEGFRLPLATRGFEFNYDKTGKKPRAWFMDYDLMNEKDSQKQQKYLRRKGVLPPLPRGHPGMKKYSLTAFVNRRKRKLTERIRKSHQLKELGTVTEVYALRKARFQGNYEEIDTVTEDELTEEVATEETGQASESDAPHTMTYEESGDTEESQDQSKTSVVAKSSKVKKASVVKSKSQSKVVSPKRKYNKRGRKPVKETKTKKLKVKVNKVQASKKVTKSKTTKTKKVKDSVGQSSGRKIVKGKTVSQKAKLSYKTKGKSGNNVLSPGKKNLKGKTDKIKAASDKIKPVSKDGGKTKKVSSKQASPKQAGLKRKSSGSVEKPKYNKMYVPVKKRKTTKEKTSSKGSETQNKQGKKGTVGRPAASATSKRKSKVARDPSLRKQVGNDPAPVDSEDFESSPFTETSFETLVSVKEEPAMFPPDFSEHLQDFSEHLQDFSEHLHMPCAAVKVTQSEAALINECGVMHDKIVILKTNDAVKENDDVNELEGYSLSSEALGTSNGADSGIGEETLGDIGLDKHDAAVPVKTEHSDPDDQQVEIHSYVIMDAETGKIKEAVNFQMDSSPTGPNEFDGCNIQVKQEPEDAIY